MTITPNKDKSVFDFNLIDLHSVELYNTICRQYGSIVFVSPLFNGDKTLSRFSQQLEAEFFKNRG